MFLNYVSVKLQHPEHHQLGDSVEEEKKMHASV